MRTFKTRCVLFVLVALIFILPVIGQKRVKEEVKVVNVEVPVRVFYKGKAVDNLSITDFKLYENKKQQAISSLNIVKKKIEVNSKKQPRFFLFLFRIYNYNEQFKNGIKYIFENILATDDTLTVLINNDSMMSYRLNDKEEALSRLEKLIIDQAHLDRSQISSYLKRVEQEIDMRSFKLSLGQANFISVQDFLKKYLRTWKNYKQKYLFPNLERYYHFAGQLEKIKKEKWVINFYQMEMLPNIIIPGDIKRSLNSFTDKLLESSKAENVSYGRILRNLLNEIEKETNILLDFPTEEIKKLFYKIDTTFHTIFSRTTIGVESRDHESIKITSDIAKCLGDITGASGGIIVSTNDVESAVAKIVKKEDIYYVLTYAPKNPGKTGKLKIKVKKKYKALYDDNMRSDYIKEYFRKRTGQQKQVPAIRIKDLGLSLKGKNLCVSIVDFLRQKTEKGTTGLIGIRIIVESDEGVKIFNKGNTLIPQKDIVTISIPFENLQKGKYGIVVYVHDKLTGKADNKKRIVEKSKQ